MSKVQNGTLYYQLRQNKISGSQAYGKYYAQAKHLGTVSFDELIEHMSNHNLGFSRGTVQGVMMGFIDCLLELLAQSKKVKIGDLGTFYLNLKSKGADTEADFDTSLISNCGLVFSPSNCKQSDLSRSAFGGVMSYKRFDSLISKKSTDSDGTDSGETGE
jgi:predicted histone-like DNA-binding protein